MNISPVEEPESKYLGHATPLNGKEIVSLMQQFMKESQYWWNKYYIGCDGTAANIVIRLL